MLYNFLKDNPECQYSIGELEEIMEENSYDEAEGCTRKHLEKTPREDFRDSLLITSLAGRPCVFIFYKVFSEIVHQSWYDEINSDPKSEKQRITGTAAEIVAADIHSMPCDCDVYPPPHSLELRAMCDAVPEMTHKLIEAIISQPGYHDQNNTLTQYKVVATEQVIMSATLLHSFLSTLLIALGVYLHRKYDSEILINLFPVFGGLWCSYEEAMRYPILSLSAP